MVPELRVYVPQDSLEKVKSQISKVVGAKIESLRKTIEDYPEIAEYLKDFRQRIVSLAKLKDSKTQAKILTGYENLLQYLFGEDQPPLSVIGRETFTHLFLESTEKSPISFRGRLPVWEEGILAPREVEVLILRFGLDGGDPKPLREVGMDLNLARERVRQIEAKALRKLRYQLKRRFAQLFS